MPECKLPQSVESEKAILGAILLDNSAYLEAVEGLSSEDFALDSHRRIFARMVTLMETGRPVDIITLVDELDVHKDLQAVGDVGYVSSLLDGVPDRPSILHYVQIVRDKAILRGLIRVSQVTIVRASAQNDGAMNILADAESAIAHIAAKPKSDAKSLKQLMAPTLDQMFRERTRETEFIGIPTGLHDLDQCLGGIREAEFWVTGGLSARGKTSFGVQFAMNAVRQDHPTMDFSLEMTNQQVVRRILAANTPAGAAGARDPKWISEEKWQQVLEHASQLATLPLWIDDSAALTLRELGARTRLYKKKFGIKLVLVDYLRLVDAHGRDLRERVTNVAKGLAFLAKEEGISIVALSQLSRPKDINDWPDMTDLKESGDIENSAHVVLLLYRPVKPEDHNTFTGEDFIIMGKAREASQGPIPVVYSEKTLTFRPRAVGQ